MKGKVLDRGHGGKNNRNNDNNKQLLLLFLTFSVLVANPKKLLYTVDPGSSVGTS